uniref:Uncharacterized protein n=1 Tax=Ditylenchus dipsaci TaxID=166011 RepID=A0A915EHC9_9BILA
MFGNKRIRVKICVYPRQRHFHDEPILYGPSCFDKPLKFNIKEGDTVRDMVKNVLRELESASVDWQLHSVVYYSKATKQCQYLASGVQLKPGAKYQVFLRKKKPPVDSIVDVQNNASPEKHAELAIQASAEFNDLQLLPDGGGQTESSQLPSSSSSFFAVIAKVEHYLRGIKITFKRKKKQPVGRQVQPVDVAERSGTAGYAKWTQQHDDVLHKWAKANEFEMWKCGFASKQTSEAALQYLQNHCRDLPTTRTYQSVQMRLKNLLNTDRFLGKEPKFHDPVPPTQPTELRLQCANGKIVLEFENEYIARDCLKRLKEWSIIEGAPSE